MKLIEKNILLTKLIFRAYLLNDTNALHDLGAWYASGDLGTKDFTKALFYYKKGALKGHPESQYDYAFMLLTGEAGHRNYDEAVKWFLESAKKGFAPAVVIVNDIKSGAITNYDNL